MSTNEERTFIFSRSFLFVTICANRGFPPSFFPAPLRLGGKNLVWKIETAGYQ
jgi:hypothetical protein